MIVTCPACSTRYLVDEQNLGATGRMVRCSQCGHSWYEAPPAGEPLRVDLSEPEAPPPLPGERRGLPMISRPRRDGGGWGKALAILIAAMVVLGVAVLAAVILAREPIMARVPATRPFYAHLGKALTSGLEWLEEQPLYQRLEHRPQLQPLTPPQPEQNQSQAQSPEQNQSQAQSPEQNQGQAQSPEQNQSQAQSPNQNQSQAQSPNQNQIPAGGGLVIQGLTAKRAVENNIPVLVISGQIVNSSAALQVVPRLRATLHDATNNTVASWTFAPDQASLPPGGNENFETSMAQPSDLASGVVVTFESQ